MTAVWNIAKIESGDIAQLGERCVRIAEVGGSNPPISTTKFGKTGLSTLGTLSLFIPYLSAL